jgi:peptide/nickel transport system permease protein
MTQVGQPAAPVDQKPAQPPVGSTRRSRAGAWQWAAIGPGLFVAVVGLIGPWLPHRDPAEIVAQPYAAPGGGLWLGADGAGRDVLAQALCGGRGLVLIPLAATALTTLIGVVAGVLGGHLGGWPDRMLSAVESTLIALPPILVLLAVLNAWNYSAWSLIAAVMLTGAPLVSRIARAATLVIRPLGFVDQAVALGDGPIVVMAREIVPNIIGAVLADAGTRLAVAITLTASAGFLGFGPGTPNWGTMVSANVEGISLSPWGVVVPALCLAAVTIAANLSLDRLSARLAS